MTKGEKKREKLIYGVRIQCECVCGARKYISFLFFGGW